MKQWKTGAVLISLLGIMSGMMMAGAAEKAEIPLNSETFPDPAFLRWVSDRDTDRDGSLSQMELDVVTKMDLRKLGIQDLQGLEYFRNLESLNCSENDLTILELTDFPAMNSLTCNENPRLSELRLEGVPTLEHLYCFHSNLFELDLHDVPGLTYFAWGGSPLTELDLSGNPELQILHVLGGTLTDADLSQNRKLETVLWNHTFIQTLDLSQQTDLTYLNCTDNQLLSLDLSHNTKLETVYAGKNQLLALRLPDREALFLDFTEQSPARIALEPGENGISLEPFAPWIQPEKITELKGGVLDGTRIQLDAPNETLTYCYREGDAVLDAAISVTGENGWAVPLSIENWEYGAIPAKPQAKAAFGETTFSYSEGREGPYQAEPPVHAGAWYVRALVEGTEQYQGLTAVVPFEIRQAVPNYLEPGEKTAVYGDSLGDVRLEAGFLWEDPTLPVGEAGDQVHFAFYTPEDAIDYLTVAHIPVHIRVLPYDGTQLPIPGLSSVEDVEKLEIWHGAYQLRTNVDYTVELTSGDGERQVTIRFMGNYTGTVLRTFAETGAGGGAGPQYVSILAESTGGGEITPSGRVRLVRGGNQSFTIQPQAGYRLEQLLVDGNAVEHTETYSFENITQNHTIWAVFVQKSAVAEPEITGVAQTLNTRDHNAFFFGYPGERFGPDDTLTRAQAAQLFYSLLLTPGNAPDAGFSDVPEDAWYARAVNTLASMGVVAGVGGEKFRPEAPITRAEFVAMAGQFAHPVEAGGMTFPDVQGDDWFYEAVQSAVWYGWISGYPDGSFGPEQPMTRAQAAAILNRMLGRSADRAFLAEDHGLREFRDVSKSHWAYFDICEAANGHGYEKRDGLEFWNAILS